MSDKEFGLQFTPYSVTHAIYAVEDISELLEAVKERDALKAENERLREAVKANIELYHCDGDYPAGTDDAVYELSKKALQGGE